ncbi:natural cytotoxicity triggering receptor 2-like [Puntigrus tetrazona]|uniref:natural cytotoxicity triggering receptor 2-like n=1 Tax=Puntigrus tetrazona TaxID=1606681 RepID=UPI001C8A993C|nr:natural cytotoxicity triggering receptor 2-like [Puntigrus tetrazona]
MRFFCVLWLWMFLTEFHSTAGEISWQGSSKGNITITCSYSWASTNIKYFCRDPCKDRDILVKSAQTPKGRYTLKDYGDGNFVVSIIDLQETDSGIYWCGVERLGPNAFKKVKLIVSKANTGSMEEVTRHRMMETQTSTEVHSTKPRHSVFISSTSKDSALPLTGAEHNKSSSAANIFPVPLYYIPYAAAGLVIVVIMCAVGLITVCQCRKRVKKTRRVIDTSIYNSHHIEENTPDDRPYATIKKSSTMSNDKSQSEPIYQNLLFNTTQGDPIYGNL